MEREVPIFDLTLEVPYEGSRTLDELLPRHIAAPRAKNVVAEFPNNPEDLRVIKMPPEKGYVSVVSLNFSLLSISFCFFPTPYS
jgi:hypothetical protein